MFSSLNKFVDLCNAIDVVWIFEYESSTRGLANNVYFAFQQVQMYEQFILWQGNSFIQMHLQCVLEAQKFAVK